MPYELEAITYCGNYIVAELYAKILEDLRLAVGCVLVKDRKSLTN